MEDTSSTGVVSPLLLGLSEDTAAATETGVAGEDVLSGRNCGDGTISEG